MTITALPPPPANTDSPDAFAAKAAVFVAALPNLVNEINHTVGVEIPGLADEYPNASAHSAAALASANAAASDALAAGQDADQAQAAAIDAGVSAQLAAQSGKLYETASAGLDPTTGVPAGAHYWVRSTDPKRYSDEYQNVGGVATPTGKSLATKAALDAVISLTPTLDNWADLTRDIDGRPVHGQKLDGTRWEARSGVLVEVAPPPPIVAGTATFGTLAVTSRLSAPGIDVSVPTVGDWRVLTLDAAAKPAYGETFAGAFYEARNGVMTLVNAPSAGTASSTAPHTYAYDYLTGAAAISDALTDYLIMINGQSWAQGGKAGDLDDATVTTSAQHPGAALMFSAGVRPGGAAVTGYVDLHEIDQGGSYETPASGMADYLMSYLQTHLGFKPRIVFCSATLGGQAYYDNRDPAYGLKRGTAVYAEGLRLVTRATEISAAAGRKLIVLAQVVLHGEQDFSTGTPIALYRRALDQWQMHFDQDARAITGQADPVRMYLSQVNRGGSAIGSPAPEALAQLAVEDRNPRIRCVGPLYQGPSGLDGAHLRALGYRMAGRLFGKFLADDLYGPYSQPLRVIDAWWVSATVARLKYSKPITIETTDALVNTSGLGADKGVKFTDGSGAPPTVTGVAIATGTTDTLEVTLSGAPAGKNPRLTIAAHRPGDTGSGATTGARSGIRSTAAIDTDALTGVTQYHWACQEQIILSTI